MKVLIIILFLLISSTCFASFEGEYKFVTGARICPNGNINVFEKKFRTDRVIHLGPSKSWTLALADKSTSKEKVPGGCTYNVSYEKTDLSLTIKTQRSSCPNASEDGEVTEKLILVSVNLSYLYIFRPKLSKFKILKYNCNYVKTK